jgi:hypothetical protein
VYKEGAKGITHSLLKSIKELMRMVEEMEEE